MTIFTVPCSFIRSSWFSCLHNAQGSQLCAFLYSIAISLTRINNLSIYYRAPLRSMPVLYMFITCLLQSY